MLHQCRKRSPVFAHSLPPLPPHPPSSSFSPSSPFPTNPSLRSLSSSCFPSNKHTGCVHYYSPGFTWTRIVAPLATTVSGEAGGGKRDVEGKRTRCLMIEEHKSPMCFLCPNIHHPTAACVVLCYLLPLAGKSSSSAIGTKELFPFVGLWIHHLLLIKPSEVVQSLSALIDSQRISSVKMGEGLHFYAAAVFLQSSCLSCTMFFASVSEKNYICNFHCWGL